VVSLLLTKRNVFPLMLGGLPSVHPMYILCTCYVIGATLWATELLWCWVRAIQSVDPENMQSRDCLKIANVHVGPAFSVAHNGTIGISQALLPTREVPFCSLSRFSRQFQKWSSPKFAFMADLAAAALL